MRITNSYRTVCETAVLVITGVVPIDLLAKERKRVYECSRYGNEHMQLKNEGRTRTLMMWQRRWESETKGRYTARLIRVITTWSCRPFGEINFYLAQFFTGHGNCNAYLHRMTRKSSPLCDYGPYQEDTAEHAFFKSEQWMAHRCALEAALEESIIPGNVVPDKLGGSGNLCRNSPQEEKVRGTNIGNLEAGKRGREGQKSMNTD